MKPDTIAIAKKAIALSVVIQTEVPEPFALNTNVRTTITMTSSMMAALTMVVPTVLLSLPSSLSAATVMLTEVAAMRVPINRPLINCSEPMGPYP